MNLSKLFLSTVLLATTVSVAESKPAMKGYRNFTQPDGTVLKIQVVGDEHLHFTVSEEGYNQNFEFTDIVHPSNKEFRDYVETELFKIYDSEVDDNNE